MCEKGTVPQIKVQHSKKFFTLLRFTALRSGDPILCLVIVAGVQMTFNIETSIDPFVPIIGEDIDPDCFKKNFGVRNFFPGWLHIPLDEGVFPA